MSWIKTIGYEEATGKLKRLYDKIVGPNNALDNVMSIHSLRPHTLEGHMSLYKSTIHHSSNAFPKWYLELLGTYVSRLNQCEYCVTHHSVGIKRNLNDNAKFELLSTALDRDSLETVLEGKMKAGVGYAKMLTQNHTAIDEMYTDGLRAAGMDDGEILEINQVVCYFNYVNRMVVSLGVKLEDDNIGLSPSGDDWSHK